MSSNIEKELDFADVKIEKEDVNVPTEVAEVAEVAELPIKEEGDEEEGDEEESEESGEEEEDDEEGDEDGDKEGDEEETIDLNNELFKAGEWTGRLCLENAQLKAELKAANMEILKANNIALENKIANLERANTFPSPDNMRAATIARASASPTASPAATAVTTPTFTPPTGAVAIKHQKTLDATMFNIEETIKTIQKEHSGRHTELYMIGVFINQFKDAATHDAAEQKSFSRFIGNKDVDFDTMKATKCTPTPSVAGSLATGAK